MGKQDVQYEQNHQDGFNVIYFPNQFHLILIDMNLPPVPGLIFQKTKELRLFTGPMSVLMVHQTKS